MRVYVNEDNEENTYGLWVGSAKKAIGGKKGQAFLKELRQAILNLPKRELFKDRFNKEGGVCALGALGLKRNMDMCELDSQIENDEPVETKFIAHKFGITPTLAWEIIYANDDERSSVTPSKRYRRFLKWLDKKIIDEPVAAGNKT